MSLTVAVPTSRLLPLPMAREVSRQKQLLQLNLPVAPVGTGQVMLLLLHQAAAKRSSRENLVVLLPLTMAAATEASRQRQLLFLDLEAARENSR